MRRLYSFILGIITVAAIIIGIRIHFGWDFGWFNFGRYGKASDKTIEMTYEFGSDIKILKLESSLMDVKIKEGNNPLVEYEGMESIKPICEYNESSKTLTIKQPDIKVRNAKSSSDNELVITLPENAMLDLFDLQQSCGDVSIDDIRAERIEIENNLGEVRAKEVAATTLDITDNLGNVEIKECTAGDVTVEASLGNVDVELNDNIVDYSITANASLGNITIDGKKYNGSFTQSGSKGTIKVDASLGDVEISGDH